jgi:hypothetical protein
MKPEGCRVLYNGDVNFLFATDYRPEGQRDGPYTAKVLDDYVERLPIERVQEGWNELIVYDGSGNGDPRPRFREVRQTLILSVELAVVGQEC